MLLDAAGVAYRPVKSRPSGLALIVLATPGPADPSTRGALAVLASLPPALRDPLVRHQRGDAGQNSVDVDRRP